LVPVNLINPGLTRNESERSFSELCFPEEHASKQAAMDTRKAGESDEFIEIWKGQFRKAIETVCGQLASLNVRPLAAAELPSSDTIGQYLWWKQTFGETTQDVESCIAWFGAPQPTWSAIGDQIAGDQQTPEQAYFEVLGRGNQGTAQALGNATGRQIEYSSGGPEQLLEAGGLRFWEVKLRLNFTDLPPMLVASSGALSHAPETSTPANLLQLGTRLAADRPVTPMFGRLMDLELPLSVALGRAVLPVRDILKITAGSLIELDRNVGQPVDLLVHGTVIARAELVSLQGNYGVRIKEVISREDRMALPGAR
jgi:flagellar motor switch protein FliN